MSTAPTDDLACDCPGALPVLAVAVGVVAGFALTAGWVARSLWHAAHDLDARYWLISR